MLRSELTKDNQPNPLHACPAACTESNSLSSVVVSCNSYCCEAVADPGCFMCMCTVATMLPFETVSLLTSLKGVSMETVETPLDLPLRSVHNVHSPLDLPLRSMCIMCILWAQVGVCSDSMWHANRPHPRVCHMHGQMRQLISSQSTILVD